MLALTWDQLELVSECVGEYRALQITTVLEAVTGALGGAVDKPARGKRRRRGRTVKPHSRGKGKGRDPAAQLEALGFTVHREPSR